MSVAPFFLCVNPCVKNLRDHWWIRDDGQSLLRQLEMPDNRNDEVKAYL
jgi:hypothetical protein